MKFLFGIVALFLISSANGQDNDLPKYGSTPGYETLWQKTSEPGRDSNIKNSKHAAQLGWEYLKSGDESTAIKRFNQAWTLYPENYSALWGMAMVLFERTQKSDQQDAAAKQFDQAIALMNEAKTINGSDASLLTDTALLYANRGGFRLHVKAEGSDKDFQEAETLLKAAEKIEKHPHIFDTWAALEKCRGDEAAAKRYEDIASEMRKNKTN